MEEEAGDGRRGPAGAAGAAAARAAAGASKTCLLPYAMFVFSESHLRSFQKMS